jgi:hypothetical protein
MVKVDMAYFSWLLSMTGQLEDTHTNVFDIAHSIPFYEIVPNDENRAMDGRDLRRQYSDDTGRLLPNIEIACSVFEMLVALSQKMNETFFDPEYPENGPYWLLRMIRNMGLHYHFSDSMFDAFSDGVVRIKLIQMVERK